MSDSIDLMHASFTGVRAVLGNDGMSLVEGDGVDNRVCVEWRRRLSEITDELNFWGRTYRRRHGAPAVPSAISDDEEVGEEDDAFVGADDAYDASYDEWEDERPATQSSGVPRDTSA
jgi:hypothetical protein